MTSLNSHGIIWFYLSSAELTKRMVKIRVGIVYPRELIKIKLLSSRQVMASFHSIFMVNSSYQFYRP